jgi:hypothetical protein
MQTCGEIAFTDAVRTGFTLILCRNTQCGLLNLTATKAFSHTFTAAILLHQSFNLSGACIDQY